MGDRESDEQSASTSEAASTVQENIGSPTSNLVLPEDEKGIAIEPIVSVPSEEYIIRVGEIIKPENVIYAGMVSKSTLYLSLSSVDTVIAFVEKSPTIVVRNEVAHVRPLVDMHKKVILSPVWPTIDHQLIQRELYKHGITMSKIFHIPARITDTRFRHVRNFGRLLIIKLGDTEKLPQHLTVCCGNKDYVIKVTPVSGGVREGIDPTISFLAVKNNATINASGAATPSESVRGRDSQEQAPNQNRAAPRAEAAPMVAKVPKSALRSEPPVVSEGSSVKPAVDVTSNNTQDTAMKRAMRDPPEEANEELPGPSKRAKFGESGIDAMDKPIKPEVEQVIGETSPINVPAKKRLDKAATLALLKTFIDKNSPKYFLDSTKFLHDIKKAIRRPVLEDSSFRDTPNQAGLKRMIQDVRAHLISRNGHNHYVNGLNDIERQLRLREENCPEEGN